MSKSRRVHVLNLFLSAEVPKISRCNLSYTPSVLPLGSSSMDYSSSEEELELNLDEAVVSPPSSTSSSFSPSPSPSAPSFTKEEEEQKIQTAIQRAQEIEELMTNLHGMGSGATPHHSPFPLLPSVFFPLFFSIPTLISFLTQ